MAYGAAVQGSIMRNNNTNMVVFDVMPLTLCIEIVDGVMASEHASGGEDVHHHLRGQTEMMTVMVFKASGA